jgi:hypothetical protein
MEKILFPYEIVLVEHMVKSLIYHWSCICESHEIYCTYNNNNNNKKGKISLTSKSESVTGFAIITLNYQFLHCWYPVFQHFLISSLPLQFMV